jgi:hypothetical protein
VVSEPVEPFDAKGFVQVLLARGWHWSEADPCLLVHPSDYDLGLRYDPEGDRLTVSPQLDEHLRLVISTPASKSRFR